MPLTKQAGNTAGNDELYRYINLKLAALGQPGNATADPEFLETARPLLRNYHRKDRLLGGRLCPRIFAFQEFSRHRIGSTRAASARGCVYIEFGPASREP